MSKEPLAPPRPNSLAEQAYRVLEEHLVTLRPAPGELTTEKDLMEMAGIGRTPVREAIQRLSAEGLLEVLPRMGLLVTPLRRSELERMIEARRVLERLLVVKAAERAGERQRLALKFLSNNLLAASDDIELFFQLDRQLNELLEAACDNRFLVSALTVMHGHCRRLWYMYRDRLDLDWSAKLHSGLALAVAEGDRSGAIRASDEIIAILEDLAKGMDELS